MFSPAHGSVLMLFTYVSGSSAGYTIGFNGAYRVVSKNIKVVLLLLCCTSF